VGKSGCFYAIAFIAASLAAASTIFGDHCVATEIYHINPQHLKFFRGLSLLQKLSVLSLIVNVLEAGDHIRIVKKCLVESFPSLVFFPHLVFH
jgi:hypothetical protein